MPRKARIDYPGALQHLMGRGIARQAIFLDQQDYRTFVRRLEKYLLANQVPCLAWALMPNHFHLLLDSGAYSVSKLMQPLLTSYAIYFNGRWGRCGHLFQNRFKSVLCQKEFMLRELVCYVHLNPLRGKVVRDLQELEKYPWSGHGVLLGRGKSAFQEVAQVLRLFGRDPLRARDNYRRFLRQTARGSTLLDLDGGGVVRSSGGWARVRAAREGDELPVADERMLGDSSFVERVLASAAQRETRKSELWRRGWNRDRVLRLAAEKAGTTPEAICGVGRKKAQSRGRALCAKWLVQDLGLTVAETACMLGVTSAAVCKNLPRGREIEREVGVELSRIS